MKMLKISAALLFFSVLLACGINLRAQTSVDVLGMHSLGPGSTSPITGARPDPCLYCHAPHSGGNMGLWNQQLTKQTYTMYSSTTEKKNASKQPSLGHSSNQCLSCHDGTVAVGATIAYGQISTQGSMAPKDVFSATLPGSLPLSSSHPFSFVTPLKDTIIMAASLVQSGKTIDPLHRVKLIGGNVECISCHNPHVQGTDVIAQNFLVRDSSSGTMCLSCHDPTRTITNETNPLADWSTSIHATSSAKLSSTSGLGLYTTISTNACSSCHAGHNASSAPRVLRGSNDLDCVGCHNGSSNVSPMQNFDNVIAEYGSTKIGHTIALTGPSSTNPHDAAETTLLNGNRHATCVDCHNAHSTQVVSTPFPDAPLTRVSQRDAAGISAADGTTVVPQSVNQYDICLRCHGSSTGKQALSQYGYMPVRVVAISDFLNVIPQFAQNSTSAHPVMYATTNALSQPSLLPKMLEFDGTTQGRTIGTQILCTDCHNSDDNRESGGTGANGPHGSVNFHILERKYLNSQVDPSAGPGSPVTINLFPTPDLTVNGPYALCGKCHNLSNIMLNASWSQHSRHINDGFSCSVCHTAHGMPTTDGNISGERLVNFDANVVAKNGVNPISYNRTANTCTLVCHSYAHDTTNTGTANGFFRGTKGPGKKK